MDYYSKYLKYKKKYIDLKNIYGGAARDRPVLPSATDVTNSDLFNNDGYQQEINTIRNTGSRDRFSLNCMYISIHDYLRRTLNYQGSLEDLRKLAGIDGYQESSEWDSSDQQHLHPNYLLIHTSVDLHHTSKVY